MIEIPPAQQALRERCVHPTGSFIPFPLEDVEGSIPARFARQVRRSPDRVAVAVPGRRVTYAELDRAANRVAHAVLAHRGPGEESIALLIDQGPAAVIAVLGVLKAGKRYVPLDPLLPVPRLAHLVADAEARLIVTGARRRSLVSAFAGDGVRILDVDELSSGVSMADPGVTIGPDAPAYIIFTSGSTGQPKGVTASHRAVLHDVLRQTNALHICAEDGLTLLRPYSVVGGVRALMSGLLNGASVHPYDIRAQGLASMAQWLRAERITLYESVATVFRHFARTLDGGDQFPDLRVVRLGGEPASPRDVELFRRRFGRHTLFVNGLGTTETGTAHLYFVDHDMPLDGNVLPVGYPTADTETDLLDENGNPVDVGTVGELVIRSRYLALGYWRRADLTAAAFLPDPAGAGARRYRTGDVGRRREDGSLEHLGRKDSQVQIRGYRVELAEVERALLDAGGVREAVVLPQESRHGDAMLVAYVVPAAGGVPMRASLRQSVSGTLPGYMVPARFVALPAIPLTAAGKVDRQALLALGRADADAATPVALPRTPVERAVAQIWAEVLGLRAVGIHDHFLDLGGDSLLATRVISRATAEFRVSVPVDELLAAATVAEMALLIVEHRAGAVDPAEINRRLVETESPGGPPPDAR